MILCLTPNPAIDRSMDVDALQIGEVHRAKKTLAAAGGKGINVARAIRTLGGEPLCMGPIGGHAGNLLADLAMAEGFSAHWTRVQSETRTCIILVQPNQDATVINEMGQPIRAEEWDALIHDVWEQSEQVGLASVSGSLPPGFPLERYQTLLAGLVKRGKSVWVDTSGPALKTALTVSGIYIKVNAAELGEVLGVEIFNAGQAAQAMQHLHQHGVSKAVITLGRQGAVFSSDVGVWLAQPPQLKIVSSVGSGDAFLGGLLFALENGASSEIALQKAVAAGAANTLEFGGGTFSLPSFEEIFQNTTISTVK